MIKLYGFGRAFGLPDPSPFVVKAEVLLKISGLPYTYERGDLRKSPKRKLPFIDDAGTVVADSTLIRFYLEAKYGIEFDKGLTSVDKAVAWAVEKMLEDNLYWIVVRERWLDQENFDKGPRRFFEMLPALLRPLVIPMIRRHVRSNLYAQGLGRHSEAELAQLAARTIDSIAALLGDKPWLMGEAPCGADATTFAFVSGGLCRLFRSAVRDRMERHANLVAYRDRGMQRWYADLEQAT